MLVLGEIALMSGESASRSSLKLSGGQEELLEAVVATGKPVVLVLVNGRPLDISWAAEHVPAILEAWYPGSQGWQRHRRRALRRCQSRRTLAGELAAQRGHGSRSTTTTPAPRIPRTLPKFKSRYWDVFEHARSIRSAMG